VSGANFAAVGARAAEPREKALTKNMLDTTAHQSSAKVHTFIHRPDLCCRSQEIFSFWSFVRTERHVAFDLLQPDIFSKSFHKGRECGTWQSLSLAKIAGVDVRRTSNSSGDNGQENVLKNSGL
jgi:hypothetical protein